MGSEKEHMIVKAAKGLFLRYGYKRVSMGDIAKAAAISRPALYLVFKRKEEIFKAAYEQWVDQTISEIESQTQSSQTPVEKLRLAFRLWAVLPFEATKASLEFKELVECSFSSGRDALNGGYGRFVKTVESFLGPILQGKFVNNSCTTERTAYLLTSAVRGLQEAATTADELEQLIDDLLSLTIGSALAATT